MSLLQIISLVSVVAVSVSAVILSYHVCRCHKKIEQLQFELRNAKELVAELRKVRETCEQNVRVAERKLAILQSTINDLRCA